ncbi:MAG: dephospho-CoA kinase [Anaeroplasmataceae bacterium]|nr:dephospho-CoA kinase [Anaeroplasmataceae bacterium]
MKRIIGITGGIASGKSNISALLQKKGYSVIDSDQISRNLSQKGNAGYQAIVEVFGRQILCNDGTINRKVLGNLIFNDEKARNKLNFAMHPLVINEIKKQIEALNVDLIFIDIPLLFEAKLEYLCDEILCAYLPYELQIQRLMMRDKIDFVYADVKIKSQMSLEEKKKKSKYVIDTSGSFEETEEQLNEILLKIKGAI